MNDRRLETLIRMAAEIEELERSATEPTLRLVHGAGEAGGSAGGADAGHRHLRSLRSRLLRASPLLAAAACVGLAVMFAIRPAPSTNGGRLVQVRPAGTERPIETPAPRIAQTATLTYEQFHKWKAQFDPPSSQGRRLIAMYQDGLGMARCVRVSTPDFGGRKLEELAPNDLVSATYGRHCNVIGPHKVIVLVVEGPSEELPDSDERARQLAQCIVDEETAAKCGIEPLAFSEASANCVPHGLRAVATVLAMR